jgi:hypothetical protein
MSEAAGSAFERGAVMCPGIVEDLLVSDLQLFYISR